MLGFVALPVVVALLGFVAVMPGALFVLALLASRVLVPLGVLVGLFRRGRRRLGRIGLRLDRHGPPRRIAGVVEALGLRPRRDQRHVPQRLAGVLEAGRKPHPRVGRQLREHRVHAVDLRRLVGRDVGSECEELRVLRRAALLEKVLHHGQGAAVVLDHQFEKQPVERAPPRRGEPLHLLAGQHARHRLPARRMVRVVRRDRLPARPQPLPHHRDLVFLGERDALRQPPHRATVGPGVEERGHLERLGVVGDHALHELHVRVGEPDAGEVGSLGGRDHPARLAGGARLDDRRLRSTFERAERQKRQTDPADRGGQRVTEVLQGHGRSPRESGVSVRCLPARLYRAGSRARRRWRPGTFSAVARRAGNPGPPPVRRIVRAPPLQRRCSARWQSRHTRTPGSADGISTRRGIKRGARAATAATEAGLRVRRRRQRRCVRAPPAERSAPRRWPAPARPGCAAPGARRPASPASS